VVVVLGRRGADDFESERNQPIMVPPRMARAVARRAAVGSLRPVTSAEYVDLSNPPKRALVMVAHPDDIDFGMAGTVAALTTAGTEVVYAIATSGEAGPPEDHDRAELAKLREQEQRAAARQVGVHDVRFLGLPDGALVADLELRRCISAVIRTVKPDLVLQQSPERRYDRIYASHPDHLAVGEATIAAVYPDARNPHAHPSLLREGLPPHSVPEVWIAGLEPIDLFVDITDVFDKKVAALSSHASQVAWIADIPGFLRGWSSELTTRHGLPEGRLTEGFTRVITS
jgi:LmbE family N-acetylglucosaminyl deacetylase